MNYYNLDNNLDEIKPGFNSFFNELKDKRDLNIDYKGFNNNKVKKYLIKMFICFLFYIVSNFNFVDYILSVLIKTFCVIIAIKSTIKVLIIKPNRRILIEEMEEAIVNFVRPDMTFIRKLNTDFKMKEVVKEIYPNIKNYNNYEEEQYYEFVVDNKKVRGVVVDVSERIDENTYNSCQGQLIEIPTNISLYKPIVINVNKGGPLQEKNYHKVEMDNSYLEKDFDIYSIDDIYAYQILTSDVIEVINSFIKCIELPFMMILKDKKIYIMFHENVISLMDKEPLNKKIIKYYARIMMNIKEFAEDINKIKTI